MADEQNEQWVRQLLVQQFVLSHGGGHSYSDGLHGRPKSVSYTEVETLWDAGLIERVSGLSEERLELVDGMTLAEARAALRVKVNLERASEP